MAASSASVGCISCALPSDSDPSCSMRSKSVDKDWNGMDLHALDLKALNHMKPQTWKRHVHCCMAAAGVGMAGYRSFCGQVGSNHYINTMINGYGLPSPDYRRISAVMQIAACLAASDCRILASVIEGTLPGKQPTVIAGAHTPLRLLQPSILAGGGDLKEVDEVLLRWVLSSDGCQLVAEVQCTVTWSATA